MEKFLVSARKHRPQNFDDVVGQKSITNTLKNAIHQKKISHSYLFCGPRGVGKTTCARILAKTINCFENKGEISCCNNCESCTSFNNNSSYNIFELDAASNNSVEDIRSLIDQVRIPPQIGEKKIYIIDEVHMLSQSAFNSFLKTLEEPPSHAIFILATTEKFRIIPTILSRCQIFDFKRIKIDDISKFLKSICEKEKISYDDASINLISQNADGALRDALSIFDRLVSYNSNEILYDNTIENLNIIDYEYYFKIVEMSIKKNYNEVIIILDEILNKGFDERSFINGLAKHFRKILLSKNNKTIDLIEIHQELKDRYCNQAENCSEKFILNAIDLCNNCDLDYQKSKNKRILIEINLIKICQFEQSDINIQEKKKNNLKFYSTDNSNIKITEKINNSKENSKEKLITKVIEKKINTNTLNKIKNQKDIQNISISDFLNSAEEEKKKEELISGKTEYKFSKIELFEKWKKYSKELINKDKISLSKLFEDKKPLLGEDFQLKFEVENKILYDELEGEKTNLLNFLRSELNNFSITIKFNVTEKISEPIHNSPEEKLRNFKHKNNFINDLISKLNLDTT